MKVKEIILAAAKLLGMEQEILAYSNGEGLESENADMLLDCFNRVENELALDYFPLVAEEEKTSENGQYGYSAFENNVVRVLRVMDEWGQSIAFKLYARYLTTQQGKVKIAYTYSPKIKAWTDDAEQALGVSQRLFAYGVAAEFSLLKGLYEEGAVWEKKYKDAIAYAGRAMRVKRMKGRVWV